MPRKSVEINKNNCTEEELQIAKACARTQQDFVRLDTLEFLLRGYSRKEVEKMRRMSPRTLRDRVLKFNKRGIDGIITKARAGRARKLEQEYFKEIKEIAEQQFSSRRSTSLQAVVFEGHKTSSQERRLPRTAVSNRSCIPCGRRIIFTCSFLYRHPSVSDFSR